MGTFIDEIIEGVNKSPLEESVKKEVIDSINKEFDTLENLWYQSRYKDKGLYTIFLVNEIMTNVIEPVLTAHEVPFQEGQNIHRNIYSVLRG